ncbi:hypothetical protein [Ottowia sp.]|uniref:hypothetical protein n=1 Tax=Ottowia sp. TaxID=1898956 RepID=UPI0025D24FBE|nr:hypothetical protein [Ottowia sp.]MBK6745784.1 hypothetical protein [Ottowia sp.]
MWNLFSKIADGFNAVSNARADQQSLYTHEVEMDLAPEITAKELMALREHLLPAHHQALKPRADSPRRAIPRAM